MCQIPTHEQFEEIQRSTAGMQALCETLRREDVEIVEKYSWLWVLVERDSLDEKQGLSMAMIGTEALTGEFFEIEMPFLELLDDAFCAHEREENVVRDLEWLHAAIGEKLEAARERLEQGSFHALEGSGS